MRLNISTAPNDSLAAEHAALIERLLQIALDTPPLPTLVERCLDELLSLSWLKVLPKAGVFIVEAGAASLSLLAQRNLDRTISERCAKVEFGHCLCGRAASAGVVQYAGCIDHRHETRFDGILPHGHYNVPIKASGEIVGVLVVYLPHGHDRDEDEVRFLQSFADVLALVITTKRREVELQDAHLQLTTARAEANGLMGAIRGHTIFSQAARDGTITDVNDAFCEISGYSRDELIGSPHSIVNSGVHSSNFWREIWTRIHLGQAWRGEICNLGKNGVPYWVDSIIMPILAGDGRVDRFVSIRHEITERKRAEEALARMGHILEYASNEVYVFDGRSLDFLLVNRGARDNLGYTSAELAGLKPIDIKPDYTLSKFSEMIDPLLRGEQDLLSFETIHERKDGSRYPVDINLFYARNENPPVFMAFVQDVTERRRNDAEIHDLALYDQLTGLANRAHLIRNLEACIARADRNARDLHLLFMDLDRFKQINDSGGHATGDKVLQAVAGRLSEVLGANNLVARIGGDEFVAVLDGVPRDETTGLVARILHQFDREFMVDGQSHGLGVSIGKACYPEDGTTAEELIRFADSAMYLAKTRS